MTGTDTTTATVVDLNDLGTVLQMATEDRVAVSGIFDQDDLDPDDDLDAAILRMWTAFASIDPERARFHLDQAKGLAVGDFTAVEKAVDLGVLTRSAR